MIDLTNRSLKEELLDQPNIPFAAIQQNMKELNLVNRMLGGHSITIKGLHTIIKKHPTKNILTVCEIGCGGGDNLIAINNWCKKQHIKVQFIGIDIKKECIDFAKIQCADLSATWIINDYALTTFNFTNPDIIFSSLFCHHFKEPALLQMLNWMKINCKQGFFINDLQRNYLAYYSIKIITSIFSNSYLVKNDAPLSVARGFKKTEWIDLLNLANIKNYTLQWEWAFRYLIIYFHE